MCPLEEAIYLALLGGLGIDPPRPTQADCSPEWVVRSAVFADDVRAALHGPVRVYEEEQ